MFMPSGVAAAAGSAASAGQANTLVAGDIVPFRGYDGSTGMGTLTPGLAANGKQIFFVFNDNQQPDFLIGFIGSIGVVPNTDADAFTQMTLDGDFSLGSVQQIYVRSAGAYLSGPPSIWTYSADTPMINGRTYQAVFT